MNGRLGHPREIRAYLDITDIRPVAADAASAEVFQIRKGTPLPNLEEVDFDSNGIPVCYSKQYSATQCSTRSCAGA